MTPLQSTILTAEAVLVSGGDVDACITAMDAYVASLSKLLSQLESESPGYDPSELARLEPLHQQVLAVAVQLLGNTSIDLRQLQAKGKAILAYTDTMPKRVSLRGKQKG